MIGRVEFVPGGRGQVEPKERYGLPMLCARVDPEGRRKEVRMKRAARQLRGYGAIQTLMPVDFEDESWLTRMGLRRVDCSSFLQEQAPNLVVEALHRRDLDPERVCVALRGTWVDGRMTRAAARMCKQVRHLVVDVPQGGENLAKWLRWEFGVAVLPVEQETPLSLYFQPGAKIKKHGVLELYGSRPELDGMKLCAPRLETGEQENLELLSVLWGRGKLNLEELKFT